MNVARHSVVPRSFLNENILVNKIELDSSLDLSIYSNILQREEEIAIGRKEVLEFCLGIGMIL
jgi:hypothetical protein